MTDGGADLDHGASGGQPQERSGGRRGPRRAVRRGGGDPDPSVRLRSDDDLDTGWQPSPAATGDDERLLREVPPHW